MACTALKYIKRCLNSYYLQNVDGATIAKLLFQIFMLYFCFMANTTLRNQRDC